MGKLGRYLGIWAALSLLGAHTACSGGGATDGRTDSTSGLGSSTPEVFTAGPTGESAKFESNPEVGEAIVPGGEIIRYDGDDGCASLGQTAVPELGPADVLWIIDGSGSMLDEAQRLQQNLDNFTQTITEAGVDTRVVLVAQNDLVPANSALAQSGNYLFVPADVDSHNALNMLLVHFDAYAAFLRPEAHVHFIVVTDDEAEFMGLGNATERASAFQVAMDERMDQAYTVHTVASPGAANEPPCVPESVTQEVLDCCLTCFFLCFDAPPAGCEHLIDGNGAPLINPISCGFLGGASRPGVTYYNLADTTGGVAASICSDDWTAVFASLSDAVIASAPLPCAYPIPAAPAGMTFEQGQVNVRFKATGADAAATAPFPAVGSQAECSGERAWYYDVPEAPTQILLCPASCEEVQGAWGGEMEIIFGCETVLL